MELVQTADTHTAHMRLWNRTSTRTIVVAELVAHISLYREYLLLTCPAPELHKKLALCHKCQARQRIAGSRSDRGAKTIPILPPQ